MSRALDSKKNKLNVSRFSSALADDKTLYTADDPDVIAYIHETILAIMKDGWGMVQICVCLEISTHTFWRWRKKYPEFEAVYQKGILLQVDAWDRVGVKGLSDRFFNEKLYTRLRANRHYEYYSDHGRPRINEFSDCKTAAELGDVLKNALGEGRLTPDEALKISQAFSITYSLKERTELEARLIEVEKHLEK